MAPRRENRGKKDQHRPGAPGAAQFGERMGGAGTESNARLESWVAPGAEMQPSAQALRQPPIPGNRELDAPRPAEPREVRPQPALVMAQHHATQPGRQADNQRTRIPEPGGVAKQPERRQGTAPARLDGARPSQELSIHDPA